MTYRLLIPILLVTLTVACTERPADEQRDVSTVEATTQGKAGDGETGTSATGNAEEGPISKADPQEGGKRIQLRREEMGERKLDAARKLAQDERRFSGFDSIDLTIPDGPATADVIEPGRYLLSIIIVLSNGRSTREQRICLLEIEGPNVRIQLENSSTDPILGTLEDGEFLSEPREAPGAYGLEGKVVGPGKLRGMVIPGPVNRPAVNIVEGRWGLDQLPLPEKKA